MTDCLAIKYKTLHHIAYLRALPRVAQDSNGMMILLQIILLR